MGTLADSLFNVLMGWVRALVNGIWALFTTDHTTLLEFLGKNWIMIVVVILAAGLAIDWLVWLIRWRPYHLWAKRARRFLHLPEPEEEETGRRKKRPETGEATQKMQTVEAPEEDAFEDEEQWLPLQQPQVDERQAQEEYQRQLAEYERQKAQYERDMARYQQEKAAYDAEMARRAAQNDAQPVLNAEEGAPRRRRAAQKPKTYSDYVSGETVEQLPDPPRWPQVQQAAEEAKKPKKGIMSRMAKMMEDDDDHEISGINALPPRVSQDEAYRPAKKPTPSGKSKR